MNKHALLLTVSSDSHSWNLVFMEFLLSEWGYQVENLGPNTPVADVINWLRSNPCELVVVSTVNGHGYLEGVDLARRVRDAGYRGLLCIGGKICTENNEFSVSQHSERLMNAGFDGVYDDSVKNSFDCFQSLVMDEFDAGRRAIPAVGV